MKFTSFDKRNLANLRAELSEVLAKYGAEANLAFEIGGMRFSDAQVEMKIKAKVVGAVTMDDRMLETMMGIDGLVREKNGKRLVQYDQKKFAYPYIYEKLNEPGKLWKCSREDARLRFGA